VSEVERYSDEQLGEVLDEPWREEDHWQLRSSDYNRRRYMRQLELVQDRRYARALVFGCGVGTFTRSLAGVADEVLALDASPLAIERARTAHLAANVQLRVADAIKFDTRAEGPWDLVVAAEMMCYLGWLYPLHQVVWFAIEVFGGTAIGGRLLLVNVMQSGDGLLDHRIIRTYRDVFVEVGFDLEHEELFRGTQEGVEMEALIARFQKNRDEDLGS
jgi:SAM-dependent methyltransferase